MAGSIEEFVDELGGFAETAERTLSAIEKDQDGAKGMFSVFSDRMFAIKGTARQLGLPHVARIAELAEEIAVKGTHAGTRAVVRKCTGCLWDALTTIKVLLVNRDKETTEEQEILVNRMKKTLDALGGGRERVSTDDIAALLKNR